MKVYVCNLMTQANESLGLTASDHVRAVYDHAQAQIFDYALINRTLRLARVAIQVRAGRRRPDRGRSRRDRGTGLLSGSRRLSRRRRGRPPRDRLVARDLLDLAVPAAGSVRKRTLIADPATRT